MNTPDPTPRPHRMRILDESGMPRTLPEGPQTFARLGQGAGVLILGLGPDPAVARMLASGCRDAAYVEHPGFEAQTLPDWRLAIPEHWRRVTPQDLAQLDVHERQVLYYEPNPRLFPTFWNPVLAYCKRAALGPRELGPKKPVVILPGDETTLLAHELAATLESFGFKTLLRNGDITGDKLRAELGLFTPALFLSINFKGLDAHGEVFASLAEAGIPAAAWCVDNPYHLLSALKSPFWKELPLFVTDDWFIAGLTALGAQSVHHLPLAAAGHFFAAAARPVRFAHLENMAIFVGRPGFPDKKRFFSGLTVPDGAFHRALALLSSGERADFGWWLEQLGITQAWPGRQVRQAGFAAEQTGLVWRVMCLREAARGLPLAIFGPKDWRELLPEVENVLAEVDYYGALGAIYHDAALTLNLTSPLLPRGLTQRHFDVWAAGGFLLTDKTPGLDLFPGELTEPVTFSRSSDIVDVARAAQSSQAAKRELAAAWREEIAARHTYRHRVAELLETLGVDAPDAPGA
ncbi:MAG: glycosyltransferase [Desulfovibrionaceae bacterium]|nr:glycosyltransferase [Desulfovibrionaceae bacterium]MBF0513267.1 glycosyltransferase [Desulfovibrionaceae bacterium]